MGQVVTLLNPVVSLLAPKIIDRLLRRPSSQPLPPPAHAPPPQSQEAQLKPRPGWLLGGLNWAVVGGSGLGKSSLINYLRGVRAHDRGAAPVGVTQQHVNHNSDGTVSIPDPIAYTCPDSPQTRLWDIPGCNTPDIPLDDYVEQFGLRYMTGLVILNAARPTPAEIELIRVAQEYQIPWYLVRSKLDIDIENNRRDHGKTSDETKDQIRTELFTEMRRVDRSITAARLFLVSCDPNKQEGSEWSQLASALSADLEISYPQHIRNNRNDDDPAASSSSSTPN